MLAGVLIFLAFCALYVTGFLAYGFAFVLLGCASVRYRFATLERQLELH